MHFTGRTWRPSYEAHSVIIQAAQPNARRIFWTGANPFAMSYENLKLRALTVRDYLIKCQTMAMFASIRDIKNKEVWQQNMKKCFKIA